MHLVLWFARSPFSNGLNLYTSSYFSFNPFSQAGTAIEGPGAPSSLDGAHQFCDKVMFLYRTIKRWSIGTTVSILCSGRGMFSQRGAATWKTVFLLNPQQHFHCSLQHSHILSGSFSFIIFSFQYVMFRLHKEQAVKLKRRLHHLWIFFVRMKVLRS